jgi:hypothetical protein
MKSAEIRRCEQRLAQLNKSIRAKELELAKKDEEAKAKRRDSNELSVQIRVSSSQRTRIKDEMDEIYKKKEKNVSIFFPL